MSALRTAFDVLADRHDAMRWAPTSSPADVSVWLALSELAGRSHLPALCLGSGSAREALPFVAVGRAVTLVDISSRMLELARHRFHGFSNVEYRMQTAEDCLSELGERRFGLVSGVGELLGYVVDPHRLLADIRAVLAPDGVLIFTWADSRRLESRLDRWTFASDGEVRIFVERTNPPLSIRTWTYEYMSSMIADCGFLLQEEIGSHDSPRRCWKVIRAAGVPIG